MREYEEVVKVSNGYEIAHIIGVTHTYYIGKRNGEHLAYLHTFDSIERATKWAETN